MDRRICIKFRVKNKIKRNEVYEMLTKVYGELL